MKHEAMCEAVHLRGQKAGTHMGEVYARAVEVREGRQKVRLKVELSRIDAMDKMNGYLFYDHDNNIS